MIWSKRWQENDLCRNAMNRCKWARTAFVKAGERAAVVELLTTLVRKRVVRAFKYAHTALWLGFNLCCWYLQSYNWAQLFVPVLFNYCSVEYWNCQFCCCSFTLLEMEKKFTWVSPSVFFSSCILTFINYQGKLNANFNMTCVFNKSKENLKMKN